MIFPPARWNSRAFPSTQPQKVITMNFLTIAGNVGKEPELRETQFGAVLSFSVADNFVLQGEKKTVWYNCSIFGERASKLHAYIQRGSKVTVVGQLRPRDYVSQSGEARTSFDVRVSEIALQGSNDGEHAPAPAPSPAPKPKAAPRKPKAPPASKPMDEAWQAGAAPADAPDTYDDEDIPF